MKTQKEIVNASNEELKKVKHYCADDQAENVAQEMFIRGAKWGMKEMKTKRILNSKYEINEIVSLQFYKDYKIYNCKIQSIIFTDSKIKYNILIPIEDNNYTLIKNVDSIFVLDNKLGNINVNNLCNCLNSEINKINDNYFCSNCNKPFLNENII